LLTGKYSIDVLGKKLDTIIDVLSRIARQLGVEMGEGAQSPGYVQPICRWLRISRETVENNVYRIYVYCAHPKNPLMPHGCPSPCPYMGMSDERGGVGAYAGPVTKGLTGLVLAGPIEVAAGGMLGVLIENMLEGPKPVRARITALKSRGEAYQLHIDRDRLSDR